MNGFALFSAYRCGHTEHTGGFSGAFSWWRSDSDNLWRWCGHESSFINQSSGRAVVDDFGNLVAVA